MDNSCHHCRRSRSYWLTWCDTVSGDVWAGGGLGRKFTRTITTTTTTIIILLIGRLVFIDGRVLHVVVSGFPRYINKTTRTSAVSATNSRGNPISTFIVMSYAVFNSNNNNIKTSGCNIFSSLKTTILTKVPITS